jgi:hypothetical protein
LAREGRKVSLAILFYRATPKLFEVRNMVPHNVKLILFVALILFAASPPARAETSVRASSPNVPCAADDGASTTTTVLLAESWGIGKWFAGANGRTRVVQFCVATMCIALFIMMRKLQ